MKILLDTCAIIWAASDPDALSSDARQALIDPDNEISVSAISAAEIACLSESGRIKISEHWKPWFHRCLELNGWECLATTYFPREEYRRR